MRRSAFRTTHYAEHGAEDPTHVIEDEDFFVIDVRECLPSDEKAPLSSYDHG